MSHPANWEEQTSCSQCQRLRLVAEMLNPYKKDATLLIVEDDDIDLMGIKRALKVNGITNSIKVARDGVEALELLRGINGRDKIGLPFVLLVDLNMPRMNGLELIGEIRQDDTLKVSPVFVLTTSKSDQDILKAYNLNVAGYIVKSDPTESFGKATQLIKDYFSIVELPSRVA